MSTFVNWQPRYAERGVATFPVVTAGGAKRPAVRGYLNLGPDLSRQLVMKFPDADALGFALGTRSRVTVLDVDTDNERVLADALDRFGKTPIVVRSGSGNFQAWFRHNGEGRRIRPFAKQPIDILGGGFVVAPPSKAANGSYQFLSGGLDDLDNLPTLVGLPSDIIVPTGVRASPARSDEGLRNDFLWRHCMAQARSCKSFDALLLKARNRNEELMPPMSDAEVCKIASSAWKYESEGRNFIGGGSSAILRHNVISQLAAGDPYAFALYALLQLYNEDKDQFPIANAMAKALRWHVDRLRSARRALLNAHLIRCVHPGAKRSRDPPLYAWA